MRPLSDIRVYPDAHAACQAAAEYWAQLAEANARVNKDLKVALAGGSTPKAMYQILAQEPLVSRVDWRRIIFFWGDERCVPADHKFSNYRMAYEALLSHVPVPAPHICKVNGDAASPIAAAGQYEQAIRAHFDFKEGHKPEFDLVILGLGEDGHIASLLPHTAALEENDQWVTVVQGGQPDCARVTLTYPVLNHARNVIWLVTGKTKADIMRRVLSGGGDYHEIPALNIRPVHKRSVWFTDIKL